MTTIASDYGSRGSAGNGAERAGQIYQRLEQNLATLAARTHNRVETRLTGRRAQSNRQ